MTTPEPTPSQLFVHTNESSNLAFQSGYDATFRTFFSEMIDMRTQEAVAVVGTELEPIDSPVVLARAVTIGTHMTPDQEIELIRNLTRTFTTSESSIEQYQRRFPDPESYQSLQHRTPAEAHTMMNNVWARAQAADDMRPQLTHLNLDDPVMVSEFWRNYQNRVADHTLYFPSDSATSSDAESEHVDNADTLTAEESDTAASGY